jgi:two-component system sensor histidine kinase/response regulator
VSGAFTNLYPFVVLCIVSAAGFLFSEYRLRVKRLRVNEAKLASVVEERTRDLAARSKALEESEKRFRQLAENIHEVFWMYDPKTDKFLYLSPAFRALWLRDPDVVLNDSSQWFAYVHSDDLAALRQAREAERKGLKTNSEYRIIRSDGSIRRVWNRSFPVYGQSGELERAVGILEDITERYEAQDALRRSRDEMSARIVELKLENKERRRAEEELKAAKDVAESASRSKSEFLANVSHEIRTPLNGITGMLQLALDTDLTVEQREFLQLVQSSADSLLNIINDVLDFSKVEAGKVSLEAIEINIRQCVEKSVRSLAVAAHRKSLDLIWYVEPDVPTLVTGDPVRLGQVLTNLLGNAIKFTESGEIVVKVKSGPAEGERLCLDFTVADTGPGIPEERQTAIFEAFTQADGSSTRKHGGTGLGLAISSQLVGLMGGEMWIDSKLGAGSTFGFKAWFEKSGSSMEVKKQSMSGEARRPVLVVDENTTSRKFLELSLIHAGFEVCAVENTEQALAAAAGRRGKFGALVAQSGSTDNSGFQLVERLRKTDDSTIPVIMLLDPANEFAEAAQCREMKVEAYFTKPLNYAELPVHVSGLMTKAKSQQPSVPSAAPQAASAVDGSQLRILLVEDNPVNRKVATRLLEKRGDTVFAACNGREALEKLEELGWDVDVVLMDVQMPEMDGYQATEAIREMEKSRSTYLPIIAVTAHAFEQDRERCLAVGMNAYISKPIQSAKLLEAIARVMSQQTGSRQCQLVPA